MPDLVTVLGTGTEPTPGPWQVTVDLGSGHRRSSGIVDADPIDARGSVRLLGVTTIGGTPTAFAAVGVGASTTIIALFQLRSCELVRVTEGAERPATLTVGGTVTHLDGIRCEENGALTVLSATSLDGVDYTGTASTATIDVGVLRKQPPTPQPLTPDQLEGYGQLRCPGIEPL
ncbi:MAG: hypothetical protein ABIV94_07870 [Acidimicrobiales bacterium]